MKAVDRPSPFLTAALLAQALDCNERTVRSWIDAGCPVYRIQRMPRFREAEVREWLEERRRKKDRPKPPPLKRGFVYFIGAAEGATPIKIGWTVCVEGRIPTLQTSTWEELVCHGSLRGTQADERAIHDELAEHRIRGEWFEREPALALLAHRLEECA